MGSSPYASHGRPDFKYGLGGNSAYAPFDKGFSGDGETTQMVEPNQESMFSMYRNVQPHDIMSDVMSQAMKRV